MTPDMIHLMDESVAAKQGFVSAGFMGHVDLLVRAIYCNFFINLAMLTVYSGNIANDFTKVVAMMAAVFIFVYLGLEHSVANTVLFTMAAFLTDVDFTLASINVLYALVGNFIGGGIMIGIYYSYINDEERWMRKRGINPSPEDGQSNEL
jgi:formate/nitrite transporter FocA (FNT family)